MSGTDSDPAADACTLCELPTEGVDVTDDDGNRFCCTGCRDVYAALGDVDVDADAVRERRQASEASAGEGADDDAADADRDVPDGHEATFLEVDGMHCATCEAFIETVATDADGVSAASASYVTDTVRVDHDPDAVTVDDLTETVSGLGYSAYARDDAFSRRQASNMATARLAAGVIVGMAVMLQYIVLIYPTYFAFPFYNERTLSYLNEAMASTSGTYFFIVIAVLTTIVLFFTGKPILRGAYVSAKTRSPNMDLLVAIAAVSAYLYSTLAVIFVESPSIYYDVTVAIIVIVTVGNHYEDSVKERATELLSEVTAVQVDDARRLTADGDAESVAVDALRPDDRILVRAGERVPVDGEAVDGDAAVDESVVTGESLPVRKVAGDAVVGGSVVADGSLTVAVGPDATSSLDRVAELVYDLQSGNHGVQKLADRLATVFVPAVLVIAVVAAGASLALGGTGTDAMLVGLTVLIVSCPCALGLATPLAVAAGIRDALERNIVVFDDTVFERIREADTVVFDKTGTLTTGEMRLIDRELDDDLLRLAAALESRSAHPVGQAIAAARADLGDGADAEPGRPTDDGATPAVADGGAETADGGAEAVDADSDGEAEPTVESFESHARGVSGVVDGVEVVVGHPDLFDERGWTVPDAIREAVADARDVGRVPVAVGRDGAAEGFVVVGDELRDGWEETVTALDRSGVEVIVLTGDDERAATVFADHDAVSSVFAGVPPEGKAETVARLKERGVTVMVGDGTNDAPALAAADLGIALGGGTAMAADAADVAIVDDDLGSVATVFELARAAGRRVKGNIGWAFCYNAVAIPLAATGLLNPLFAAVAMGASSLLVVTNSSRALLSD
ncbi:Lead, cadmium, zinc and mercury transporting ATPase; Copper-translocating P-type ATPase [Halorubrum sp. DM2]|uniref:heavy metal translocating P-type ATPase n=1 Tax=Halorubrum sp. DM2 TaxID=2527867 RepID=UPI0024B86991|nr:cation-translocating P-type ATPase [Halorubrum sp. DM2]VTT87460.1 Lead, cadmium, zinc and mercury transporting ATPase; Copper-translocating P-type ATPase [Halorubrum sp. DM2]